MKNKQSIMFKGINKAGQTFMTESISNCVINSVVDPVPINRKSNRVMLKIIKGLDNDNKQEHSKTKRLQKEKREKRRKASYLSKRFNRVRSKAA